VREASLTAPAPCGTGSKSRIRIARRCSGPARDDASSLQRSNRANDAAEHAREWRAVARGPMPSIPARNDHQRRSQTEVVSSGSGLIAARETADSAYGQVTAEIDRRNLQLIALLGTDSMGAAVNNRILGSGSDSNPEPVRNGVSVHRKSRRVLRTWRKLPARRFPALSGRSKRNCRKQDI
jgi:hypothetical protein